MKTALQFLFLILCFTACSNNKEFDAMGVFESDEIIVSSEISGKIMEFDLQEGQELKEGQVLGFIDTAQLELNIAAIKQHINALKAQKSNIAIQISPLKERLENAKIELQRATKLYKSGSGTKKAFEDANSAFNYTSKEIESKLSTMQLNNESLDNEIANNQTQIQILEDKIQKAIITSPINGVVLEKYSFKGELSTPNKPLFKIANLEILRLKAYVIDTDLTRLKLGDEVLVFVDFGKEYKQYKGIISHIAANAEFTPKTIMVKDERKNLVYEVKIDVINDGFLKIGSYGEIKLQ